MHLSKKTKFVIYFLLIIFAIYFTAPHIIKCFLLKIQGFLTLSVSVNKPELRTFRCIWY